LIDFLRLNFGIEMFMVENSSVEFTGLKFGVEKFDVEMF
jgi:hypothetical protein